MNKSLLPVLVLISLMLCACAGVKSYENAFQSDDNKPNVKTVNAGPDRAYTAVSRAMLTDNFRIEKEDKQNRSIAVAKYSTEGSKTIVLTISVAVREAEAGESTIYATAVQSVNKVRVKNEYFSLLIIPTPIKTSSQATQTKEEETTIEDPEFYVRFFKAVDREIAKVSEINRSSETLNDKPIITTRQNETSELATDVQPDVPNLRPEEVVIEKNLM